MLRACWVVLALVPAATTTNAEKLEFGPKTILVYRNEARNQVSEFVLRLARFQPDIFLEWESVSAQGTVLLTRESIENAPAFTLSGLFEVGVDTESSKVITKWLPRRVFRELLQEGKARIKLNNIATELKRTGEGVFTLELDKVEVTVPVIELKDGRNGEWKVLNDASNPILLEYSTPYYNETLVRVSTSDQNQLRWIKDRRMP